MAYYTGQAQLPRSIYYGSYKEPRELVWILGVLVYLLMVVTGFMGYVLVWGQMSFWAATVITNLFSAIPIVGDAIVTWLLGGYAVVNPTLNRFLVALISIEPPHHGPHPSQIAPLRRNH